MYCKECGKKLLNDAKFCIHCGAEVPDEVRELLAEEKTTFRFKPDPDFRWNTEALKADKKPQAEDDEFVWDIAEYEKRSAERKKNREAAVSDKDPLNDTLVMERGKNAAASERSTKEIILSGETAEKALTEADAIIEEIKRGEAEENARATAEQRRIDKFYTFNRKNEEFQQLLDRQIERLKVNGGAGETDASEAPLENSEEVFALSMTEIAEEAPAGQPEEEQSEQKESSELGMLLGGFEEKLESELNELKEGETAFNTRELNRDLLEIAMENAELGQKDNEVDIGPNRDKPELKSDFKPQFMLDAEQEESGAAEEIKDEGAQAEEAEALPEEAPSMDWEKKRALDALWGTMELSMDEAAPAEAAPAPAAEAVFTGTLPLETAPAAPYQEKAEELGYFEEEEGGGGIGRVIIALLMIIVIAEVLLIGIRVYMPDSSIGLIAANELGFLSDWFFKLTGFGGAAQ